MCVFLRELKIACKNKTLFETVIACIIKYQKLKDDAVFKNFFIPQNVFENLTLHAEDGYKITCKEITKIF